MPDRTTDDVVNSTPAQLDQDYEEDNTMRCVNCGEPVAFGEDHECPDKPVRRPPTTAVSSRRRLFECGRCGQPIAHSALDGVLVHTDTGSAYCDAQFCVDCGERITSGRRCTYHQNVKDGFG